MSSTSDRVAGLVLAAGRSSRFGATKQVVTLDGRPLVGHATAAARDAGCHPVLVVVGHDAHAVRAVLDDDVEAVENPDHTEGQSTSLRAGIAALADRDVDAVVVLLADQPGIRSDTIRTVAAACRDVAVAARASYDDGTGHPVCFGRAAWPRLLEVTGDRGARDLLVELGVVDVRVPGPCPPDVDRPEDLSGGA